MPKAHPKATRELAESLILQGFTPAVVAEKTGLCVGIINSWKYRRKWLEKRNKAKEALAQSDLKSLAERSAGVRSTLAGVIEAHATKFAEMPCSNGHRALKLQEKAEPLVRNAAKVFGWEPGAQTLNILAVQTLDDVEPDPDQDPDHKQ